VSSLADLASRLELYLEERVGRVRSLVDLASREFYLVLGLVKLSPSAAKPIPESTIESINLLVV